MCGLTRGQEGAFFQQRRRKTAAKQAEESSSVWYVSPSARGVPLRHVHLRHNPAGSRIQTDLAPPAGFPLQIRDREEGHKGEQGGGLGPQEGRESFGLAERAGEGQEGEVG